MITYTLQKASPFSLNPEEINAVVKTDSSMERQWTIPFDPANIDYQAYLKWVEEGNIPLPADKEQA